MKNKEIEQKKNSLLRKIAFLENSGGSKQDVDKLANEYRKLINKQIRKG